MKKLSVKNVVGGILFLGLLIKAFPLALTVFVIWGIHRKQYFKKPLRIFFYCCLGFIGLVGALLVNLPEDSTPQQAAPAATKVEKAAPAAKQEAPKQDAAPAAAPAAPAPKAAPVNIITTIPEDEAIAQIKAQAKQDWATDFEEQQYVINEQTQAYHNLKALVIDSDIKEQILNQAHSDWGYDFDETLYVYNEQLKAYNGLNQ